MTVLILPHHGKSPIIHESAFIADTAVIIGDVEIGPNSSIWFGTVVRGDVNIVRIGARTNIEDGVVIHVASRGRGPTSATTSPSDTWRCCTPAPWKAAASWA